MGTNRRLLLTAFSLLIALVLSDSATGQQHQPRANSLHEDASGVQLVPQSLLRSGLGGDPYAARRIGDLYFEGHGFTRDYSQAAQWYRRAAEDGDPSAQIQIGYLMQHGLGTSKNLDGAAQWYARAAAAGSPRGQLNLALMYINGSGVKKDVSAGRVLLTSAARKGDTYADVYLGDLYFFGDGVPRDLKQAESLYVRAAKKNNPMAFFNLGSLYSVSAAHTHDARKASLYLRQAVELGYSPALHSLGLVLVNHPELQRSANEGIQLLETSARQGNWKSAVALGALFRDGTEVARNDSRAYLWFRVAEYSSDSAAQPLVRSFLSLVAAALPEEQKRTLDDEAKKWTSDHPCAPTLRMSAEGLKDGLDIPVSNGCAG